MELKKRYYSTKEAASLSGLSQKMLRAGCRSGRFPHTWSGRKLKIDLEGVYAVLDHEQKQPSV